MGIKEMLFQGVASMIIERPGRNKSLEQWCEELVKTGNKIEARAAAAENAPGASGVLRHITGIERWSQNRLRVFLGEAYTRDEYDHYQPGTTLDLAGHIAASEDTRTPSS